MDSDIVILGGKRSAIGTFGGALAQVTPLTMAETVASAAIKDSGLDAERIGQVVFGQVLATEPRDLYLPRVAAMNAGVPDTSPAFSVNRLCGSGAQAVVSGFQALKLGDADFALVGGTESMSRAPFVVPGLRWGTRMGDAQALDMMLGALTCPFGTGHMGITAENVSAEHEISREDQDAFALESQARAARAHEDGHFTSQIAPVPLGGKRPRDPFAVDEHPKTTSAEALASLRPAFRKDGSVTAGNASGLNDGAAALVLARADAAKQLGLTPRARIAGYAIAGVRPEVMGLGPIPAVEMLLKRTEWDLDSVDLIESNEAFAAQALAVNRALGLDPAKVNPDGGAIALGHPVGATGAILTIKALYALERKGLRRAIVTMCIGGGQGIALAMERL